MCAIHLVLVAVIFLLCTKTSSSVSESLYKNGKMIRCIEEERKALLLLFKQDVDNERDLLPSWKKEEEEDCCKWKGVVCHNRTGHVTQLHLYSLISPYSSYSSTSFSIGNSLLDLPYLNYLDLSNNDYLEEIPVFIGSLTNLVHLDLSDTGIWGSIPYQIGSLSNLHYLDLSSNNFNSSIPKSIGSLNSLTYLDLSSSRFYGVIPHELGNLSKLQHLDLSYNYLAGGRQNFELLFNLSSLTYLDLSTIKIAPPTIWSSLIERIPSIAVMRLNNCNLPGPSSTSSNLSSSMSELYLRGNYFTSSIFKWLYQLRGSLIRLDLSYNMLDGSISHYLGNMTALTHLNLAENQLNGSIPESFALMTALNYLDLSANQLDGVLPQSVFNLSNLSVINISKNKFTGSLPDFTHFSSFRGLKVNSNQSNDSNGVQNGTDHKFLDLSSNYLTGSLPNFTGFASLESLHLNNNMFYGSVPDFTGCSSLGWLRLDNNKLTEWKTQSTGLLSHLVELDLSMNSIHSTISEAHLSNLSSLMYLSTSFNSLKFEINSEWLPSFQLRELSLAACKLGPKFPNWIRNQNYLSILDISNSHISDTIPLWFWNNSFKMTLLNLSSNKIRGKFSATFVYIQEIDLSSNYFEGSLPAISPQASKVNLCKNKFSGTLQSLYVGEDSSWSYLDISHNQLVGALPDYWMHFQVLAFLNLGHNSFTGRIPKSIGNIVSLRTLILRNNKLYGELPITLRKCSSLGFLDVGLNKLSGKVPSWIGKDLPNLYALILKSNRFYARLPREICHLSILHFLDLSINKISGTIPPCFDNLTAMMQKGTEVAEHMYSTTYFNTDASTGTSSRGTDTPPSSYYDNVLAIWKGQEFEYGRNFALLKLIDLSTNELTGEIPIEITRLVELKELNLSGNRFYGRLPLEIGQLKELECLDLSTNQFSGNIPLSLSALNFLAYLDLSDNNFWGRIPSGTQLQGFSDAYEGNTGLCGKPLKKICLEDEPADHVWPSSSGDDTEYDRWLYISSVLGFSTTFWGIIGTLVLNRRWRHAYFLFLDNLKERIYVVMAVQIARSQRKI